MGKVSLSPHYFFHGRFETIITLLLEDEARVISSDRCPVVCASYLRCYGVATPTILLVDLAQVHTHWKLRHLSLSS